MKKQKMIGRIMVIVGSGIVALGLIELTPYGLYSFILEVIFALAVMIVVWGLFLALDRD
jgi:hypothetical protein